MQTVPLPSGEKVPALGMGTWMLGDNRARRAEEIATLQRGIDLGMRLIDTAEMYGEGASEKLVGEAIKGRRAEVFLVSKVYPHNAGGRALMSACERSLQRLGVVQPALVHVTGLDPFERPVVQQRPDEVAPVPERLAAGLQPRALHVLDGGQTAH